MSNLQGFKKMRRIRRISLIRFFIFICLLFSLNPLIQAEEPTMASENMGSIPTSIEWQQELLSQKLREKVIQKIKPVIKSNDIVVYIDIQIDNNPAGMESGNQAGKSDKDKKRVRLSDVDGKKLKDDYIVFSKLGLEAPYIDEFSKTDKMSLNNPGNNSFNPVKMANQFNIFKFIKNLSIKIYLNEKLSESTRDLINDLTQNIDFNLPSITPQIEVIYISFDPLFNMSFSEKVIETIKKYNTSLALIMMAIILGIMALLLVSKIENALAKLSGRGGAGGGASNNNEDDKNEQEEVNSELSTKEIHKELLEKQKENGQTGAERFKSFYTEFPKEAVNLIRKWIGLDSENSRFALIALTSALTKDELQNIFKNISVDERKKWKKVLEEETSSEALSQGDRFIFSQIIEEIIVPNRISDPEITSAILSLTPESCAKFSMEYPDLATILMNVLHPQFANQVLDYLDENIALEIIQKSTEADSETLENYAEEFKEKIKEYGLVNDRLPFIDKLYELINTSNHNREGILFKALKGHIPAEEFNSFCINFIPSEVILQLPSQILKNILKNLESEDKIKLIYTAPKGMKEKLIEIVAPEGSKSQQMLEIEFQKIANDKDLQIQINESSKQIWGDFFNYGREFLKSDPALRNEINSEIEKWSQKIAS